MDSALRDDTKRDYDVPEVRCLAPDVAQMDPSPGSEFRNPGPVAKPREAAWRWCESVRSGMPPDQNQTKAGQEGSLTRAMIGNVVDASTLAPVIGWSAPARGIVFGHCHRPARHFNLVRFTMEPP